MEIDKNSQEYKDYMKFVDRLYDTIHELENFIEEVKGVKIPEDKKQQILCELEPKLEELWSV